MDAKYKYFMCRLCLCKSGTLGDIHGCKVGSGLIAAAVVTDLLQLEVSATDCYPQLVCLECLKKLYDFRCFKDSCWKAKDNFETLYLNATVPEDFSSEEMYGREVNKMASYGDSMETGVAYPNPCVEVFIEERNFIPDIQIKEELTENEERLSTGSHICDEQDPKKVTEDQLGKPKEDNQFTCEFFIKDEPPQEDDNSDAGYPPLSPESCQRDPLTSENMDVEPSESNAKDPLSFESSYSNAEVPEKDITIREEETQINKRQATVEAPVTFVENVGNTSITQIKSEVVSEESQEASCMELPESPSKVEDLCKEKIFTDKSLFIESPSTPQTEYTSNHVTFNSGRTSEISKEPEESQLLKKTVTPSVSNNSAGERLLLLPVNLLVKVNVPGQTQSKGSEREAPQNEGNGGNGMGKSKLGQNSSVGVREAGEEGKNLVARGLLMGNLEGKNLIGDGGHLIDNPRTIYAGQYFCNMCSAIFPTMNNLTDHVCERRVTNNFECKECGKKYETEEKLKNHARKHKINKNFFCQICGKGFRSEAYLTMHFASHKFKDSASIPSGEIVSDAKPAQQSSDQVEDVPSEGATSSQTGQLEQMVWKSNTGDCLPVCPVCSRIYSTFYTLKRHMMMQHSEKNFKCVLCPKKFRSQKGLDSHARKHRENRPYRCDVCGKGFFRKDFFEQHVSYHAIENPFQCDRCKKKFDHKKPLWTHILRCYKMKTVHCSVCNKQFTTQSYLSVHMTIHTGEKNLTCEVCGKSFRGKNTLSTHRRQHTGEKPYSCDICNKSFIQRTSYVLHNRRYHS